MNANQAIVTPYVGMAMNLAEPIKIPKFEICGFAAETRKPGADSILVWESGITTSDDPGFHKIVDGINGMLAASNIHSFERCSDCLIIIHADNTADVYIDTATKSVLTVLKTSVKVGYAVLQKDIADIRGLRFPAITFLPDDKVFYSFRVGWKFGLFFDFSLNRVFDVSAMESALGHLYRTLRYEGLYGALNDQDISQRLIEAGWFPFVEIINTEFKNILMMATEGYDLIGEENRILEQFSDQRIDRMTERWWANPIFTTHRAMLEAGITSFKRKEPIPCLKTILTEIEGILCDAHIAVTGKDAKTPKLLEFMTSQGIQRANGDQTLFFPHRFQEYLGKYIYPNFDPANPSACASRHTVGHGRATAEAYTQTRALQALLTIDQIAFFL